MTTSLLMSDTLREDVLQWLKQEVPEKRLRHILRVEEMAIALAQHHGLSVALVQQAGLMHDLAKCFPPKQLLAVAEAEGWTLDPAEVACPHLLHAPVGAVVARDTFGVSDERVLKAISNHTLGSPDMDAISCVVYLADALEPGRGDTLKLQRLRDQSYRNLQGAVYETCVFSLQHLLENRRPIHPRTILTHNGFLNARHCQHSVDSAA
ncbi:bis(5'-nucleosyl)-tetraphosphatase (symmetrical) YqeK [Oscillatoria sp. CS-180]|uniref:bis(5'-nucleosyl)-tetraphosphatase (symmetrical) YqeK n=1 Tax=Oscillatoria sp. CS-180 TaxID=3021720 RepID=UPI0023304F76|nr:bis(5'-nucleosyl)-tetraphosphatase (symmetrical) YqeK [Oscillatoria sp. CS-180]MDB9528326.1 bis(5'-nucleosyl)-tetraphosphatase (symmetrical) YqeK [Oscillatoria sp. CS-180]